MLGTRAFVLVDLSGRSPGQIVVLNHTNKCFEGQLIPNRFDLVLKRKSLLAMRVSDSYLDTIGEAVW